MKHIAVDTTLCTALSIGLRVAIATTPEGLLAELSKGGMVGLALSEDGKQVEKIGSLGGAAETTVWSYPIIEVDDPTYNRLLRDAGGEARGGARILGDACSAYDWIARHIDTSLDPQKRAIMAAEKAAERAGMRITQWVQVPGSGVYRRMGARYTMAGNGLGVTAVVDPHGSWTVCRVNPIGHTRIDSGIAPEYKR